MPFGLALPLEATRPGGAEERAVARQDMQGFSGLKACLRKPCMWQQNCRNLHVPLATWEGNSKKIADITQYYCSRIREVSEPAATPATPRYKIHPLDWTETPQKRHAAKYIRPRNVTLQFPSSELAAGAICNFATYVVINLVIPL